MTPDEPPIDRDLDDLRALRDLPPIEPRAAVVARVRQLAGVELAAGAGDRWLTFRSRASRAWSRVGLPAALAVTVVGYLSWAVTSASALYR